MIRFLSIRHLALVEELELEFQPGLTVLTGETGAGKSIVLGALGLLVGGRASGDLVRTGEEKAVVQATVETSEGREIILRREVTAQGRSRAFIDDTLATLAALQTLGMQLVDLHGQHQHQALLDPHTHLQLLDTYGGLTTPASAVGERFRVWRAASAALGRARLRDRDKAGASQFLDVSARGDRPGRTDAGGRRRPRHFKEAPCQCRQVDHAVCRSLRHSL